MKAIVFVDCQNDFMKGGALGYGFPVKGDLSEKLKAFADYGRKRGWQLYATADTHLPSYVKIDNGQEVERVLADGGYFSTLEGKRLPVEHCIEGTEGHKIIQGLVKDDDGNVIIPKGHIVDKSTFGSFDLLARIDQDFVVNSFGQTCRQSKYDGLGEPLDEIFIVGVCTSICVVSNALMLRAKYPNIKITVFKDLCGDIDEVSHNAALKVMMNCQIDVRHAFSIDGVSSSMV